MSSQHVIKFIPVCECIIGPVSGVWVVRVPIIDRCVAASIDPLCYMIFATTQEPKRSIEASSMGRILCGCEALREGEGTEKERRPN